MTLKSLALINSLFGNHRQSQLFAKKESNLPKKDSLTLVDIGCGGGDCLRVLQSKLDHQKINYIGIDGNSNSIEFARNQTEATNIKFITDDILSPAFELPPNDLLISSHFIYHFEEEALIRFLKKTKETGTKKVFFSDLRRSRISYFIFKIAQHLLPINRMAKKDGLIAIKRAFTLNEMKNILQKSGFSNFEVRRKPWFRMLVTIHLNN